MGSLGLNCSNCSWQNQDANTEVRNGSYDHKDFFEIKNKLKLDESNKKEKVNFNK